MTQKNKATSHGLLAAALYALSTPLSKELLHHLGPSMMAAFLYLGAGLGIFIYKKAQGFLGVQEKEEPLTRKELPYTLAMVLLDIAAPILLMLGIARTNSSNVSLLNNFEIVATSLIALFLFKEVISKRLWLAIVLVTLASILLTFQGEKAFAFNQGSLFVLAATILWGFENNCTKMLSSKSSLDIVVIKGIFSGIGSLLVALVMKEPLPEMKWILAVLLLGFVSFGLSIHLYIKAQKDLGAAKTSAYYSIAPFLGVVFSMLLLGERPGLQFYCALLIMSLATALMIKDTISLQHTHQHVHTHLHEHAHQGMVHAHEHDHIHTHLHVHEEENDLHQHFHKPLEDHHHPHPSLKNNIEPQGEKYDSLLTLFKRS